jgi:hypothetical protein
MKERKMSNSRRFLLGLGVVVTLMVQVACRDSSLPDSKRPIIPWCALGAV